MQIDTSKAIGKVTIHILDEEKSYLEIAADVRAPVLMNAMIVSTISILDRIQKNHKCDDPKCTLPETCRALQASITSTINMLEMENRKNDL